MAALRDAFLIAGTHAAAGALYRWHLTNIDGETKALSNPPGLLTLFAAAKHPHLAAKGLRQ